MRFPGGPLVEYVKRNKKQYLISQIFHRKHDEPINENFCGSSAELFPLQQYMNLLFAER